MGCNWRVASQDPLTMQLTVLTSFPPNFQENAGTVRAYRRYPLHFFAISSPARFPLPMVVVEFVYVVFTWPSRHPPSTSRVSGVANTAAPSVIQS